MNEPAFEWTTEEDGDHQLAVDGEYFGLVCVHHARPLLVWGWGDHTARADSLDEAKRLMERHAIAERASRAEYERVMADA